MVKLYNSSSLHLRDRITLKSSPKTSTFVFLCLFIKIQQSLEIKFFFFCSWYSSPCLKESFLMKTLPYFLPDLPFCPVHDTLIPLWSAPQVLYQRRRSGYMLLLCSGLLYRTLQSNFLALLYMSFSLNWIAERREELFLIHFCVRGLCHIVAE